VAPSNRLDGATIAFDLDGTLVDTAPDLIGALNRVLTAEGLAPVTLSDARHLVGRGAKMMLMRGFAEHGRVLAEADAAPLVERFIDVYRTRIADESLPFPGCVAALDDLRALGARLVVCTNKRTDLSIALLDALSLRDRFEAVIGADSAPAPKPDPRHVLHAIDAAGGVAAHAVMVGDSANDVDAARAAGVPTIVFPFGYTETPAHALGADRLIDHYDALVDTVQSLLQHPQGQAIGSPL
jgi:phosphoglycolate phosphatase